MTIQEKKLKSFDLDMASYRKIEAIYTDPATVLAIVETGIKVYNMFKRKKTGPSAELQYLRKIHHEINEMRNDIRMIIDLLQDLKVYIDKRQVDFIANTLTSKINTVNLFLIGWLESGKGNLEEQFSAIHETKTLLGIYGFAHIHVYMLAFQKELDLCYWLKKGRNFTDTLLEESKNYFNEALNTTHHLDTPAKRLAVINSQIAELENRFSPQTYNQNIQTPITANRCGTDGYKVTQYTLVIQGTLADGFTFNISEKILKIQNPVNEPCGRNDGGPGGGIGGHFKSLENKLIEVSTQAPNLDAVIQNYKNAYELHLHYTKAKLELHATINTITGLLSIIEKWHEK